MTPFTPFQTRVQLKTAVLKCLLAFLEGSQRNDEVPQKMLSTLHWENFAEQMHKCYLECTDPTPVTPIDLIQQEGIQHYFLMRYLKHYDNDGVIQRQFVRYQAAVTYFEHRTGYLEIARNDVIERVYFELPSVCLSGGALDRPFEEMYKADRDNADTKSKQFLSNMVRILEREQHYASIRDTGLAWTVDRWKATTSATFNMSLLINAIMVMGGYTEDAPNTKTCMRGDGTYDSLFALTILPITISTVSYLGVISFLMASLRLFSFFWARCCSLEP